MGFNLMNETVFGISYFIFNNQEESCSVEKLSKKLYLQ